MQGVQLKPPSIPIDGLGWISASPSPEPGEGPEVSSQLRGEREGPEPTAEAIGANGKRQQHPRRVPGEEHGLHGSFQRRCTARVSAVGVATVRRRQLRMSTHLPAALPGGSDGRVTAVTDTKSRSSWRRPWPHGSPSSRRSPGVAPLRGHPHSHSGRSVLADAGLCRRRGISIDRP